VGLSLTGNREFGILSAQSGSDGIMEYIILSQATNGDLAPIPNDSEFRVTPDRSQPTPKPGSDPFYAWPQWGESPLGL
jgi:hypothetical protein